MKQSHKLTTAILILLVAATAIARTRHHRTASTSAEPGKFDYYVFALSWSPEFCYSHPDKPECQSGHHGFVVHGLWPQFVKGYPENCSTAPGLSDPLTVADLMPDAGLVQHEWTTHGTCSGLGPEQYFKQIRQAWNSVKIPQPLAAPTQPFNLTPDEVKQDFLKSNPQLKVEDLTVSCGHNFLTAVSVCMSKSLEPTACQQMPDCHANQIKVPPVR